MIELGALFIVFILAMVLALAIRENETELRTTMQVSISILLFANYISIFSLFILMSTLFLLPG
jgi:hypothetical protein